ncbi:DUF4403 family protein [Polyangium fumosum]|nr:DUF4403 family protein [Polyangium fumosum]
MSRTSLAVLVAAVVASAGCGAATPVYPPRPPATPGEPVSDPVPSRVVVHATITGAHLQRELETAVPRTGEGTFPMLGNERRYTWNRGGITVRFNQGRIALDLHVDANAEMPIGSLDVPLEFSILAEPVVTSEYKAKLQSLEVTVKSDDRVIKAADAAADILGKVKAAVKEKLEAFEYDLYPTLAEAHGRLSRPIELPLGDANGCAALQVVSVEAGPTVLAGGFEKDLALVVAPSVTIPCAPPNPDAKLPPLANVATLQPGPFTVTVPIVAKYDELAKAMGLVFTDGKFFFSKEHPKLYMEKPELYAAKDQIVLKLHIAGHVDNPVSLDLDGDLFMTGHPTVVDNELRIPDLEPTIETKSFLFKLKASMDGDKIRDQARDALRLDIGERLKAVRDKLSNDISFASGQGCMKAQVHKIEVSSVHVHGTYMRVYVTTNAIASVYMPCP